MRRITKELKEFNENPPDDFTAGPEDDSDIFKWVASIPGPEDSPYEGGTFELKIEFPKYYPIKPPMVKFTTKVYHPNVRHDTGYICLCLLRDNWKSDISVTNILKAIQNLLIEPKIDCGCNPEVRQLYIENKAQYDANAKEWTEKYAM